MSSDALTNPMAVIDRLLQASNAHDLPGLLACMAPEYSSDPPAHPNRAFWGRDQVGKNWSAMFEEIPNFHIDLLDHAVKGNQAWVEWKWSGTLNDQSAFDWRGVMIFTVEGNQVTAARIYMEPVDAEGAGIDATVSEITKR